MNRVASATDKLTDHHKYRSSTCQVPASCQRCISVFPLQDVKSDRRSTEMLTWSTFSFKVEVMQVEKCDRAKAVYDRAYAKIRKDQDHIR